HGDVRARGAAEQLQHAVADERADHEDVAVGEVEELQDPVDERVPERDERIDATERQRVDGELDEGVHRKARWAALRRPPGVSDRLIRRACTSRFAGSGRCRTSRSAGHWTSWTT